MVLQSVRVLGQALRLAICEPDWLAHVARAAVRVEGDVVVVVRPLREQVDRHAVLLGQVGDTLLVRILVARAVGLGRPLQEHVAGTRELDAGELLRIAVLELLVRHRAGHVVSVRVELHKVPVRPPLRVERHDVVGQRRYRRSNRPVGVAVAGAVALRVPLHERVVLHRELVFRQPLGRAVDERLVLHRPHAPVRVERHRELVRVPHGVKVDDFSVLGRKVYHRLPVNVECAGYAVRPSKERLAVGGELISVQALHLADVELLVGHRAGAAAGVEPDGVHVGAPLGVENDGVALHGLYLRASRTVCVGIAGAVRLGVPLDERVRREREAVRAQLCRSAVRELLVGHLALCVRVVLVEAHLVVAGLPLCVERNRDSVLVGEVQDLLAVLVAVAGTAARRVPAQESVARALELVLRQVLLVAVLERLVGHRAGPLVGFVPDRVLVRPPLRIQGHGLARLGDHLGTGGHVFVGRSRAVRLGVPPGERIGVARESVCRQPGGRPEHVVGVGHLALGVVAVRVELDVVAVGAPLRVERYRHAVQVGEVLHLLAVLVAVASSVPLRVPAGERIPVALELVLCQRLLDAVLEGLILHRPRAVVGVEPDSVLVRAPLREQRDRLLVVGGHLGADGTIGKAVTRSVRFGVPRDERVCVVGVGVEAKPCGGAVDEVLVRHRAFGPLDSAVGVELHRKCVGVPLRVEVYYDAILVSEARYLRVVLVCRAGAVLLGVPAKELPSVGGEGVARKPVRHAIVARHLLHLALAAVRVEGYEVHVGTPLGV